MLVLEMVLLLAELIRVMGILLIFLLFFTLFFVRLTIRFYGRLFILFLCIPFFHSVVVLMLTPRLFMWLVLREIVLLFFLLFALLYFEGRFL